MQIKYVGPKPVISESGIDFASEYDDRYTYLNILLQLIHALNKDYFEERTYHYAVDSKRLDDKEILAGLQHYCGNLDEVVSESVEEEKAGIDNELKRAKENRTITEIEKSALIKNIEVMRNYRLQYITNDALYHCAVKILADQLKKDPLDYVVVPMFQRFAAILRSVQDELTDQKFPIDIAMDIYEEDGKLMAKMEVKNRL
ncbi:MAG: hypothetical protein MUP09_07015 [Thiovulaceae bacterium]|nr:hypothetical protein [Sulfurimonadaceae bacterium]